MLKPKFAYCCVTECGKRTTKGIPLRAEPLFPWQIFLPLCAMHLEEMSKRWVQMHNAGGVSISGDGADDGI